MDGTDARVSLTGRAMVTDLTDRITSRLPVFIAAVVAMSFLLLMIVFRSILVPLKAALMNLLSIAAAYGVLVAVFQWGWGEELIGLHSTMPINPFLPLIMFAILFGLSMDYEVFLLSRVREEYVATGDNHEAVVRGLSSTARVITSAALIMISVFGAFVLSDDPNGKLFGVGLAVAVLIDATLVRMVLVPATMSLLGRANWWLPGWLDRILPHLDLEGAPSDARGRRPEPERELSPQPEPPPERGGCGRRASAAAAPLRCPNHLVPTNGTITPMQPMASSPSSADPHSEPQATGPLLHRVGERARRPPTTADDRVPPEVPTPVVRLQPGPPALRQRTTGSGRVRLLARHTGTRRCASRRKRGERCLLTETRRGAPESAADLASLNGPSSSHIE